jgi:hypothetical protein
MDNETLKLKREIDILKKEVEALKNTIRQEIIAQQVNTRDPFRSDRGEIILKKTFNLKSRKSVIPTVDKVTSMYFNEQARTDSQNYFYLGHDGGNGQRFTNTIAGVATDLLTLRLEDFNNGDGTPELIGIPDMFYAIKVGDDRYSILGSTGANGLSALATSYDGGFFTNLVSKNFSPEIHLLGSNPLRLKKYSSITDESPATFTGASGTITTDTQTITVTNGIITNIA